MMSPNFKLLFGVWASCAQFHAWANLAIVGPSYLRKRQPLVIPSIESNNATESVVATSQTCFPPATATTMVLDELAKMNCLRVTTAANDFAELFNKYGKYGPTVKKSWDSRMAQAMQMCSTVPGLPPYEAAESALAAWGDVMMQHSECCSVAGPPFCIVPGVSKIGHFVPFLVCVVVIMLARLSECICRRSVVMPNLVRLIDTTPGNDANGQVVLHDSPSPAGGRLSNALLDELMNIFHRTSLSALPDSEAWARPAATLFAALQPKIGFQADSAKNQFEHFLSLWRAQCSMVADRAMGRAAGDVQADERDLASKGLVELNGELLDGFKRYRDKLHRHLQHTPEASTLGTPFVDLWTGPRRNAKEMAEVSAFLLVWGEAGNVRFMPEVVCFIVDLLLSAKLAGEGPLLKVSLAQSSAFLASIIRPLYNRIFDETYVDVIITEDNKDKKNMHAGLDKFMPADCANYDDWNELFCDPARLTNSLVLRSGTKLFDLPAGERFAALAHMDWGRSLASAKTHREIHSLWGLFASIHRVAFLHELLFALTLVAVSSDRAESGEILVAGKAMLVRLSAVGLLVPLHAACWKLSSWFTAGSAVRKHRCRASAVCKGMPLCILMSVPVASYILVRYVEVKGDSMLQRVHTGLTLQAVAKVHLLVSACGALVILCGDSAAKTPRQQQLTPTSCRPKVLRWLFWLIILLVKAWTSWGGVHSLDKAMDELMICRLGKENIKELPSYAFSPKWDKDMVKWLLFVSTGFMLYIIDTQFWFSLGCSVLGVLVAFQQRSWKCKDFFQVDSVARIPERFSNKVLGHDDESGVAHDFPLLWDTIVKYMRDEDKVDDDMQARLSYVRAHGTDRRPRIFNPRNSWERRLTRQLGLFNDPTWPQNPDVQWRIMALARGLTMKMPRPFRAPYIPGVTVLIPHYMETILTEKKELYADQEGHTHVVPLMSWLEYRYEEEFKAFSTRMAKNVSHWPQFGTMWGSYGPQQWKSLNVWASMRSQTLWRTVAGMTLYHQALETHFKLAKDPRGFLLASDSASDPKKLNHYVTEMFTCLISMQMYPFFDDVMFGHTNKMLDEFPDSLKIAFIDFEEKGAEAERDGIHSRQSRRYYSCLIDKTCKLVDGKRREPRLRVELPGYPILGDGKGDNQNHAIPFSRGMFIQAIDANQGAYFEQMLLLPCVLGEFRDSKHGDLGSQKIVGFPEHITSDFGSIGDFAAGAETAFGTILQRSYAVLGGRMHYGHPDMMNKIFMIQQGGISKATKTVNLSEDIFAGLDFTLRGDGRKIQHTEYFHLAKGRDLGFNTVLLFFSKLSAGTGEQMLTRQMARLSQQMGLPEALTLYYAHGGFYLTQFLLSKGIPLLVFIWLFTLLDGAESNFEAFGTTPSASVPATMGEMLIAQFGWVMVLFLVAGMAPLLVELSLEIGILSAIFRCLKQFLTLSPLHFIFQAKIIGWYVSNEILYGGASYVSTGRGLPTERRFFIGVKKEGKGLYNDYAPYAFYDGAELLAATILALLVGGLQVDSALRHLLAWWGLVVSVTVISWLFAPFIFNPYQFEATRFWEDLRCLTAFFMEDGGRHWVEWYNRTQLRKGSGRSVVDIVFFLGAFFIVAWYAMMNVKIQALGQIFAAYSKDQLFELNVLMLMPPFICSMAYCVVAMALERIMGCYGAIRRLRRRPRRSGAAFLDLEAGAPGVADGAEVEEAEAREVHVAERDRAVKPAADPQGAGGESGCRCCLFGMPLAISAVCVLLLDIVEAAVALYRFTHVGWWRAFVAGLMLKWGISCLLLHLGEGVLRSQVFERCGRFGLVLDLWVRAHRMARDILTSVLILVALTPLVLINMLNDYLTPGLSLHHLLIYRNPNHLGKREAIVHACQWDVPEQPGAPQPKA
mmetsp:Transcript_74945/g.189461  ORF Transcript_74945/g.189461 Transcript_74945/m.189461 type:complete len:1880 (+) Transcript_74945:44-5683(+)